MIAHEQLANKQELAGEMAELALYVQEAARKGLAAHQVEEGLFRRLLSLGHALYGQFLARQGSGDIGPELAMPDGQVLQREPERVDREYARIFGDETGAESFVREQTRRVLHGQVKTVIHSLRARATRRKLPASSRESLEEICQYFENNRSRMRYDQYLRAGLRFASGTIEGACRHVVKDRLERTGMSWTRTGAQAILNLRAIWISDQWQNFEKYWTERQTDRLYSYRDSLLINALEWPVAA